MGVNKVDLSTGENLFDISQDTVTPETLAEGVTAHDASGEPIVGTMVAGGGSGPTLVRSGSCGENATWAFYDDGHFVVSGSGETIDVDWSGNDEFLAAISDIRDDVLKITIEDGITTIGVYLFRQFSSVTDVVISDSVTSIGNSAFSNCKKLTSIKLSSQLSSIGSSAFISCSGLKNIIIPNSVTEIGSQAFMLCSSLEGVIIPYQITNLNTYIFYNCKALSYVIIPESVVSIGRNCFYGCTNLSIVFYAGKKERWDVISIDTNNEPLINATLCCEYVVGGSGIIDVTELPTENIDENAVYRVTETVQTEKTEIYIKRTSSVITIQQYLTSLGVPTVPNIYVVDELPSDMLPTDVQTFSQLHFYILKSDGIVYANVPAMGGVITGGIFGFQATGYDKGFTDDIYTETEIGVYTTIEAYKEVVRWFARKAGNWEEITAYAIVTNAHGFTNKFALSGKVTTIDALVSGDIEELDESWFVRPDGSKVLRIRAYTFYGTNLKRAVIPRYIISIDREALGYCNELTTVTFKGRPAGGINKYLFVGCHNLTTINVPWSEGEVADAPWGATNATINYNYTGE